MKSINPIRYGLLLGSCVWVAACAPVTPLPGSIPSSLPTPSSSGSPGGTSSPSPSSLPGGTPSNPGGSPGGSQSPGGQPSGSSSGGLPGGQSGGQSGGLPGSESSGIPGGQSGSTPGEGTDPDGSSEVPTWDVEELPGGGDDEWETSNEVPGLPTADGGAGEAGADGGQTSEGGAAGASGDDELDGALKDFDGEILAERDIIRSEPNQGTGGSVLIPAEESPAGAGSAGNDQASTSPPPIRRSIPNAPPPPRRGAESGPDNLPDAKDDDIIARQLREAAMAEQDPELKDKLWDEYRKYKKG